MADILVNPAEAEECFRGGRECIQQLVDLLLRGQTRSEIMRTDVLLRFAPRQDPEVQRFLTMVAVVMLAEAAETLAELRPLAEKQQLREMDEW